MEIQVNRLIPTSEAQAKVKIIIMARERYSNRFASPASPEIRLKVDELVISEIRSIYFENASAIYVCAIYIDSRSWNVFFELGRKMIANRSEIDPNLVPNRSQIGPKSVQIGPKSVPNRSQIGSKSVPNRSQIDPKSIKNDPNSVSEALLDPLGPLLGAKLAPRSIGGRFWGPFWGRFGVICSIKIRYLFESFFKSIFDRILIDFGGHVWRFFGSKT